MRDELLSLLPDDILKIIWSKISPVVKCDLNQENFDKYYIYKLRKINNNYNSIQLSNLKYIRYIFQNDLSKYFDKIMYIYVINIVKNNKNMISSYFNKIYFNNIKYNNFIDFVNHLSCYYNSYKCNYIFNEIIKKYNLIHLIQNNYTKNSKNSKNNKNNKNNKNIKWKI